MTGKSSFDDDVDVDVVVASLMTTSMAAIGSVLLNNEGE